MFRTPFTPESYCLCSWVSLLASATAHTRGTTDSCLFWLLTPPHLVCAQKFHGPPMAGPGPRSQNHGRIGWARECVTGPGLDKPLAPSRHSRLWAAL